MFARRILSTSAASLIAILAAACGGTPEPAAPVVAHAEPSSIAIIEVPRLAPTLQASPPETTIPRQADAREAEPRDAPAEEARAPTSSMILVPCPPSSPNCGVLGVLSGPTTGPLGPSGGGGLGGPIGLGNIGGSSSGLTKPNPSTPSARVDVVTHSTSSPISNADTVVAGMRAGFRRCYGRLLQQDPGAQGTVSVRADVASDGSVTKAAAASQKPLDAARACIEARVASAKFAPPDSGKAATVMIALKLTPPAPPPP